MLPLASFSLVTASLAVPASATDELAPVHPAPVADDGTPMARASGLWFVQLESPPVVEGGARAALRDDRAEFRAAADARGVDYTERMTFETLWNGLSVELGDAEELTRLRGTPGVEAVFPVVSVPVPETATAEPDLATALGMTGADIAQSELGLSGEGVRVAVMDTGIDYQHPDLGGPGPMPTGRVVAGHDFVGDAYNAGDPANLTPVPDGDPMDCNGHGTHVAGIVGAEGEVTGVAPGVVFGAYKVFGCTGSTTSDIMVQAMERAYADDMDVLNMSIGSGFSWPQYPTAVASDNLVARGVVVVASIGNDGDTGAYSAGAPGLGRDVIGVASFDNTHISALSFQVDSSGRQVPYLPLAATQDPPTEGTTAELANGGRGCPSLGDTYPEDLTGRVALLVRGDCTFAEKYDEAVNAGAVGVVIYNNGPGLFSGGGIVDRGAFGVGVSDVDGAHLLEQLEQGPVTLTWTDEQASAPNPTGGLISSFSSYGLAPDLTLKPDIGAPGGLIRSTYPLELGGYAAISGTSMSSPHVAGGVALLLETEPDLSPAQVRDRLRNTADPQPWWGDPSLGYLDQVHRQGAGMLDVPGAVQGGTTVSPSALSLGESQSGPSTQRLRITNNTGAPVRYTLGHEPALGTHGDTYAPGANASFAEAVIRPARVTVPAGRSITVRATITAPAQDFAQMQYGGYLTVTDEGGETVRVPYAGYVGDYQEIDAIAPIDLGGGQVLDMPWLTRITACDAFIGDECVSGGRFANQPDGASYTLETVGGLPDIPYVTMHFDHQVERLELTVLDAETGEPVNGEDSLAVDLSYVERSGTPTEFFAYAWDGTLLGADGEPGGQVPDGRYILSARALKALGDEDDPAHWETWTSPEITIARP
nr:S8 family serine peptidase [Allonocardiopsis opalescens]